LDADNVIIRYLRVRPGDTSNKEIDAISCIRNKNIIIDHCSFSWAIDEVASFYDNENFTLQWCIISESFYNSFHHKGEHGYGGIWGGLNATFHHNLLSDHTSRNPRFNGARYSGKPELEKVDFRNNVIYNWGFNSIYGGEEGSYNIINNYFKPGPATRESKRNRILELTRQFFNKNINSDTLGAGWFYIEGNVMDGNKKVTRQNWKYGVEGSDVDEAAKLHSRLNEPIDCMPVETTNAVKAFRQVIQDAGASLFRDALDKRIVDEALSGIERYGSSYEEGKNGIIDSQNDVGGWPLLKSCSPPADSDNDGMPDNWEKQNDLNPFDASDNTKYNLTQNYTNLEVYINSLVK
ncbi:MAG: pectate lyase family protein, partial [Bacteroidota bacterium]